MEPISIYKYREFDQFGWDIIRSQNIFFSSPQNFNDPRDCKIPILAEQGTEKQIYNKTLEFYNDIYPKMSRNKRKYYAKQQAKIIYSRRNESARKESYREKIYKQADNTGVFSASEINNNKLLWSHYSGGHQGFCLKLNVDKLVESIFRYFSEDCIPIFQSVEYTDKFPKLNPYKMTDEQMFMKMFFTKSTDWKYEQEFRIVLYEKPNSFYHLVPNTIEHIYLGSECTSENKVKMINAISSIPYNIGLSQAVYDELQYQIKFEDIVK